ncbi:MAG: hypothetical protein IJI03_07755 [Rudaea sp.]|nr:hypothetical protein [Rudaea sp.]
MLRFILLLSLIFAVDQAATAAVVRVADGDCTALQNAVAQAGVSPTTVLLARNGNYLSFSGCGFSLQKGNLTLEGNGSTITSRELCVIGTAIDVETGASLTVRNLQLIDQTLTCMGGIPSPRIRNAGTLSLENVTVTGNGNTTFVSTLDIPTVGPNTSMRNTTWMYAGLSGSFEAYNSTFVSSTLDSGASSIGMQSTVSLSNSLLFSTRKICPFGGNVIVSHGGNVASDSSCGLSSSAGDKIVSDLNLPAASSNGGLVPTIQIGYDSPARHAGVAQYCEATDARGVTRNAANCDAGAYETGGGLGQLTQNGMNGLYYVPGIANGHYVSLQRVHDNKDVMVFWDTFDNQGNQAWIFGVGTLTSDRHIPASMSRNLGGVLQPGGPATGAKASAWGTVDIDLTSCAAAQFNYQSSLPDFGSGQFALTRLAFESAINCGD